MIESLRLPIIAAPMFLVSGPEMVTAACHAGIVGTFPALNCRTSEEFEDWLVQIKASLNKNNSGTTFYGVNLIVHPSNPRLQSDLDLCVKHKVPLIITSLGAVPDLVGAIHEYGGLVYHDIIKRRHAEKASEAGVDGLICVSAGAGGHAGHLNPMSLIHEVKSIFDGTILLAGSISTGQDVATALQMGADFAYMGTRFINTVESRAQDSYKNMICDSLAGDIVYTSKVSGIYANFMKESLKNNGYDLEKLESGAQHGFDADLNEEAKAWKTVWSAGHGVTAIKDIPSMNDLVDQLEGEFIQALERQSGLLKKYRKS